ncbi:MAG: helix-turn-helix domain-containing protein [Phycisphaerales bacterium]|nr:helix-turn-helix domain-containing protein [Phycisphaerales bacterium]
MTAKHDNVSEAIRLLLRPDEAAKALAISPRKLWELTNCGEVPCIRIGRAVRYVPADLQAWIDRQAKRIR